MTPFNLTTHASCTSTPYLVSFLLTRHIILTFPGSAHCYFLRNLTTSYHPTYPRSFKFPVHLPTTINGYREENCIFPLVLTYTGSSQPQLRICWSALTTIILVAEKQKKLSEGAHQVIQNKPHVDKFEFRQHGNESKKRWLCWGT